MSNQKNKKPKIKCKFCDKYFLGVDAYVAHLERVHSDEIPPDMTPWQFYYFLKTGKTEGKCVICGDKTSWNEKTHHYNRMCGKKSCHDKYVNEFRQRMIGKYGKITLLNEPEQQKIMLSRRKISGEYEWSTREGKVLYTGSYELNFLEFLDNVMGYNYNDIIAPSPHTYYYIYDNKRHFYIPDFFIPSLNLEIEIKDGSTNENKHPKIQAIDKEKERLKDEVMERNGAFDYVKIVNKENKRFFEYLELAKNRFVSGDNTPIIIK